MPENQNFYIIQHGVRLSGMPGWKMSLKESELWQVTAFLSNLEKLPLALLAWLRDRRQRMLLWLALYTMHPLALLPVLIPGLLSFRWGYGLIAPIICVEDVSLWFLLLYLLGLRDNPRLVRWTRWMAAIAVLGNFGDGALQLFPWTTWPGHLFLSLDVSITIPALLVEGWGVILVLFAFRRGLDAARWFLAVVAVLADLVQAFGNWFSLGVRWTHWTFWRPFLHPLFSIWGNEFDAQSILNTLLLVAIVYAVWRYQAEQSRRQNRLDEELRSAQELQQVLVPESVPELRGYSISSVYKPAAEVGGDFFQVIPCTHPAHSALIILGDVSGKGLRAAMTVSLIVGALRAFAETMSDPSEILAALSRRLHERLRGGFATCIAVRVEPDGRCIIASAGHLAPYRQGEEIPLPAGLPLGIVPDTEYPGISLQLSPGDTLMFLSDGVVEAQSPTGELFGFDRTRAISTLSAEAIATAASPSARKTTSPCSPSPSLQSRCSMRRLAAILLALFAPIAAGAQRGAAPLDARQLPPGVLDVTQSWRVHQGDNSAWAEPDFDDSAWATESLNSRSASEQGWRWFRVSIQLPQESTAPLSLLIDGREGAYELFIDGQRVHGPSLRSPLLVTDPRDRSFPFPRPAAIVHIALRVHIAKRLFDRAPAFSSLELAPAPVVAARQRADEDARLMSILPSLGINLAVFLAGIGALGLFFAQKRRGEYLWLGVFLAGLGGGAGAFGLYYSSVVPVSINWFFAIPVNYLSTVALIEFIFRFAGRRVSRPWRIYESVFLLAAVTCPWLVWFGILGYGPYNVVEAMVIAPASLFLPVLLFRWYMAGNREAGWLILPTLFPTTTLAFWDIGVVMQYFGLPGADRLLHPVTIGPLSIQAFDLADAVFLLAIGVVMFFRFTRISHEQARATSELEAAQRVQALLLCSQQNTASNIRIESVYRPAQEVGGDFFHTCQIAGSARVVVGDVSGKGLGAAMLVAAIVGALDTMHDADPAAVLRTLNNLLLMRQQGGFATCLCACVSPRGNLRLANAGHLAPYRNGEEVPLESGLPLGISPDVGYAETILYLEPGETFTFMSDGVVEARNQHGELFGFDRTRGISSQSAEAIAAAAQAHGQEDDITVLTLTFAPVEVLHA